jgi:ADP-ribosyl-[dinitrogen reductase] hydrolase
MKPHITSCLIGGALGDSVGLPSEGISARRIGRMRSVPLQQALVFGCGMVSDDTEHAVMTLLSLCDSAGDEQKFGKCLARRLRWWLASVPAGIGLATARSIIKLWLGFRPSSSGVFSAGNGPLMRAPVIGVWFVDNLAKRESFIRVSTAITHRDPRAVEAALLIAEAAAIAARSSETWDKIIDQLERYVESAEMKERFAKLRTHLCDQSSVSDFANSFSRKKGFVSGFAPDTCAVALYAWLLHRGDFRATVESVILAGGDTDTVAFVAGSLAGAECGMEGLEASWLNKLKDWPLNLTFLKNAGHHPKGNFPQWPLLLIRNFVFLIIVLTHGFRRLLPPY